MIGQRFSRLLVIKPVARRGIPNRWTCQCDCGVVVKEVDGANLRRGHTRSCGCLREETKTTHGATRRDVTGRRRGPCNREYTSWSKMINRCYDQNAWWCFDDYGGRGITVCRRWRLGEKGKHGFTLFYEDMGKRPIGMSLDRKNNDGNYSKRNCRWATPREQRLNSRPCIAKRERERLEHVSRS
jgi:hypothetical protein